MRSRPPGAAAGTDPELADAARGHSDTPNDVFYEMRMIGEGGGERNKGILLLRDLHLEWPGEMRGQASGPVN